MSDNVVSMRKDAPIFGQPNSDVVEVLENLLHKAKSGELQGLAYATFADPSGGQDKGMSETIATGWECRGGAKVQLAGAIALLFHRYNARLLGMPE